MRVFILLFAPSGIHVVHISAGKYLGLSLYLGQVPHDHIFEGPKTLGLPGNYAARRRTSDLVDKSCGLALLLRVYVGTVSISISFSHNTKLNLSTDTTISRFQRREM